MTENKVTPPWEFNGEILIHYGNELSQKSKEDVLYMLNAHQELLRIARLAREFNTGFSKTKEPK